MRFVERAVERAATMPRGPERHALSANGRIRPPCVIRREQLGSVDENRRVGGFTRKWADIHNGRFAASGNFY
jgi:hypothetical protein